MERENLQLDTIGVVVIGRNEGERLKVCLAAVLRDTPRVVYVDSGSSDDSVTHAGSQGVEVVLLDKEVPFTAARARNVGFNRLRQRWPEIAYVQFVDGDCELVDRWLATAMTFLQAHPRVGAVCGRLRERFPDASVYNRLCDAEWDRATGETNACGGIVMMRGEAFVAAGQFRSDLVAGEEPELCSRLRDHDWTIWRLSVAMAFHDAAILHFRQWWMRSRRGGYGSALLARVPGYREAPMRQRHNRGIVLWSLVIPVVTLGAVVFLGPAGMALLLAYPAQIARLAIRSGASRRESWEVAFYTVLSKFPAVLGLWQYRISTKQSARQVNFDYKH